jgi:conjugal transfer mating pair stabilization protein TraN
MDQTGQCTNFEVFSGQDERCRPSGLTTIFSNCCNLSGWFKTWCQQEERELKKRKQADTCVEVGNYCSSDIFGICIQTKQTWCCFNSELSQIINAQGRPQINKGWGTPKNPDCSGFTPQQLSGLDFSTMNFSAYVTSVQSNENLAGAQTNAVQGATNWLNKTTASPQNPPYAPQ